MHVATLWHGFPGLFSRSTLPRLLLGRRLFHSSSDEEAQDEARRFLRTFTTDTIPRDLCAFSFSRSSGPGGQNVNKLNTKATLRLVSAKTAWIPSRIREQLSLSHAGYVTKEGDLLISSQRNRTQEANREDCFQKLASLIVDAGSRGVQGETTVETREKVGRMMKRGNEQRLKGKKIQSAKKGARRSRGGDD